MAPHDVTFWGTRRSRQQAKFQRRVVTSTARWPAAYHQRVVKELKALLRTHPDATPETLARALNRWQNSDDYGRGWSVSRKGTKPTRSGRSRKPRNFSPPEPYVKRITAAHVRHLLDGLPPRNNPERVAPPATPVAAVRQLAQTVNADRAREKSLAERRATKARRKTEGLPPSQWPRSYRRRVVKAIEELRRRHPQATHGQMTQIANEFHARYGRRYENLPRTLTRAHVNKLLQMQARKRL